MNLKPKRLPRLLLPLLTFGLHTTAFGDFTNCVPEPANLVSWWRGEYCGADETGRNPASPTAGIFFSVGEVGSAFGFDGTTNYVRVPASTSLDIGQSNGLTLECWISPTQLFNEPILDWSPVGNYGVHLWTTQTGSLYANLFDTNGNSHVLQSPGNLLVPGLFQHVAVTYDKASGIGQLFLNGAIVDEANLGTFTPETSYDLFIGYRQAGAPYGPAAFSGLIDEMTLYARALATNEIQAVYDAGSAGKCLGSVPPSIILQPTNQTVYAGETATFSVVADGSPPLSFQWNFNGARLLSATNSSLTLTNLQLSQTGPYQVLVTNDFGSITSSIASLTVMPAPPCTNPPPGMVSWWRGEGNANDSVGMNPGALFNGAGFAPGLVQEGLSLNGVNQYAQVSNAPSLNPTAALSLETWVYPISPLGAAMDILSKDDESANRQYLLNLVTSPSGQPVFRAHVGTPSGFTVLNGTNVVQLNTWNYVAMTYDGSFLRLYVNGALDTSAPVTGPVITTTQPLRFGRGGSSYYFHGLIDEISLYDRALTAQEIQGIYNASAGGKCLIPISPSVVSQPTNQTVMANSNAIFRFTVGGTVPFNYQWSFGGTPINGATSSSLVLTNVQFSQNGTYSAVASNIVGWVSSTNVNLTVVYPPARVLITNASAMAGGNLSFPVWLVANGNENALAFSLSFDPTKLSYAGVTLGNGAAGAALTANTSAISNGKIGLFVNLPQNASFAAGTQQVVQVQFALAIATSPSSIAISFGDQPTVRQLLDSQLNSLPASYSASATITIAAASFEGDVFPRPNGDKALTIADWLLSGRYAARLDYPTNGSEFQRADCAPRSTLGNGALTVSDWVQVGRYAFGLDPLTVAGGPTNEIAIAGAGPATNRFLLAGGAMLSARQPATVSVVMAGQGNENALALSLGFDPTQVSFSSANLGTNAGGATLYVNTDQAASGRIGIALALGAGSTFPAGTNEVLQLNFVGSPSASGSFSPAFMDVPVPREISDAGANALPVSYANGTLPSLLLSLSSTNLVLASPAWATNFILQEADGALPPAGVWSNVTATSVFSNNESVFVFPIGTGTKFFRLKQP
ncbi:MAG TPA: LamG-like jellyroll fold domain-containing protein [Verrucomicrobiae bacterium]|nr:LamG-like jellyroll fold domain-containing protein [Verrucomicrobiae bacterium]